MGVPAGRTQPPAAAACGLGLLSGSMGCLNHTQPARPRYQPGLVGKCLLTRVTAQWPVCDRCNGSPLPGHTDDGRLTAGLYLGFNFQTATVSGCGARGWVCMTLARVTMSALSPEMNGTDPPWIRNTSPSALYL